MADSAIGYASPPDFRTDSGSFLPDGKPMDYHLKPIGKTCAATEALLEPGTLVHSVLIEKENETVRLDFSAEEWTGPPEGAIGHWRCIVPFPEVEKSRPLDPDSLLEHLS